MHIEQVHEYEPKLSHHKTECREAAGNGRWSIHPPRLITTDLSHMSTGRKVLIVASVTAAVIILAALCVPLLIPDRNTANEKALLKNLAEPRTNAASQF